jgi:hypothetical protein
VIPLDAFRVEPWSLRETHLDLDPLAQTESVFALANGQAAADGALERALDVAEPDGAVTPFLLHPFPGLLDRHRAQARGTWPTCAERSDDDGFRSSSAAGGGPR